MELLTDEKIKTLETLNQIQKALEKLEIHQKNLEDKLTSSLLIDNQIICSQRLKEIEQDNINKKNQIINNLLPKIENDL